MVVYAFALLYHILFSEIANICSIRHDMARSVASWGYVLVGRHLAPLQLRG